MVDIRKLSSTTISDTLCAICPEEEKVIAKMFCFECEQNLCERCGVSHRKIKLCQNHQVVEIGKKIKEASYRNSYCDQHLGEIVKMYCEDDKATICFLCFAENHQAHKCVSVTKASEELSSVLRNHLEAVKHRLPECKDSFEKLVKLKAGLLTETAEAEQKIVNEATRLKDLVDSHANILLERLTAMRNKKLKEIENAQQDVDRFQTMIASCARYLEELLNKGAPGDICREANQMKTRAEELASLPGICCGCDCCWDNITFKSSNLEDVCFNSTSNIIGNVHSSSSCTQLLSHDKIVYVEDHVGLIPEVVKNPATGEVNFGKQARTIVVNNIPGYISTHNLTMRFQSEYQGGRGIEKIVYTEGKGTALITFTDSTVADALVRKGSVPMFGRRLFIQRC